MTLCCYEVFEKKFFPNVLPHHVLLNKYFSKIKSCPDLSHAGLDPDEKVR